MAIDPKYYVQLKGRSYPVYAGVLLAAMEAGLRSLTTDLVQIPSEENGQVAIVKARAEFADGRIFEDYGDCSPRNVSPQIATASIRMASTRAKGRTLRDAIGLGETLKEELPDDEMGGAEHPPGPTGNGAAAARAPQSPAGGNAVEYRPEAGGGAGETVCMYPGCEAVVSKNEQTRSQHHYKINLCKTCFPVYRKEHAPAS